MLVAQLALPARAAEEGESAEKPERELVAAFEYPWREMSPTDELRLDLIVKNNGRKDETVLLQVVSSPENCTTRIETYGDVIGGVFIASGEKKTLQLIAEPKKAKRKEAKEGEEKEKAEGEAAEKEEAEGEKAEEEKAEDKFEPGEYVFEVQAKTEDGALTETARATVRIKSKEEEEAEEEEDPVEITCSYPNLRGSSDGDFKFSIDVRNNTDEDDMVALRADAPPGWEVAFKPSYEDKYIGSLKVDANLSRSVDVEVDPPPDAEVGTHKITVFAKLSKEDFEAKRELTVELTGTYRLECRTLNDLLSLTAHPGEPATVPIYVINRGTAPQHDVRFESFQPEKWKVTFKPERIDTIEPGDREQVEVTITPSAEAIVGDYSVGLNVRGEESAEDDVELRVTVRAPTTWAWVGVGVIVVVIVGLSAMFKVLGRR